MRRRVGQGGSGAIVATAAMAITGTSAPAGAQQGSPPVQDYRLDFRPLADATCPSEQAFRADVAGLFNQKQDVFTAGGRHVVRVTIAASAQGPLYESTVEVVRPDGTLHPSTPIRYEGLNCWLVTRQAAVASAANIPRLSSQTPAPPTPAGPPAPVLDEARVQKQVEEAQREAYERGRLDGRKEREGEILEQIDETVRRRLAKLVLPPLPPLIDPPYMTFPFAVSAGPMISIGYALDVAPAIAVGVEWRPAEVFSVGVEARYVFAATGAKFGVTPLELPVSILSALVAPCLRWKIVVGCAAVDVGGVRYDGGLDYWRPRVAAGPRAGIDVPFAERFSARLFADLLFPVARQMFPIFGPVDADGNKPVVGTYETPVVSGFITAGVAVAF